MASSSHFGADDDGNGNLHGNVTISAHLLAIDGFVDEPQLKLLLNVYLKLPTPA